MTRLETGCPNSTAAVASDDLSPQSVLVAGGAGFIGSRVCLRLRQELPRARIVAFDNLHRRGAELLLGPLSEGGVEFVHGDVRNAEDFAAAGECDLVIEAAAEPSVLAGVHDGPGYVVRSNLVGAVNCLEYARRCGAGIILVSSSRVYPIARLRAFELARSGERFVLVNPREQRGVSEHGISEKFPLDGTRTLYGATKLAAELVAAEYFSLYGVPGVINRCGVIAGPWQMARVDQGVVGLWCSRHVYGGELAYIGHSGFQVRDVLHVDDFTELLMIQIRKLRVLSGSTFNVGGGLRVSCSLRELTRLCVRVTGRNIPVGEVDDVREGDVPYYVSDCRSVERACGWVPRASLEQIVIDTVEWLRQHETALGPVLNR